MCRGQAEGPCLVPASYLLGLRQSRDRSQPAPADVLLTEQVQCSPGWHHPLNNLWIPGPSHCLGDRLVPFWCTYAEVDSPSLPSVSPKGQRTHAVQLHCIVQEFVSLQRKVAATPELPAPITHTQSSWRDRRGTDF